MNTFRVQDNLEFWYCRVDMAAFVDEALSIYDSHVYAALCTFAAAQGEDCFPSVRTLAKRAKCSERQTRMSLRVLEERGYITTTPQSGGVNLYTLTRNKRVSSTPAESAGGSASGAGDPGTPCRQTISNELKPFNENKDYSPSGREASLPGDTPPVDEPEPESPGECLPVSEAPAAMKSTAEYLLLKTGRKGLTEGEISALRRLNANQYPARVQTEIDKAVDRFGRLRRPLQTLTFEYISDSLANQASRSTRKGSPEQRAAPRADYSDLNV